MSIKLSGTYNAKPHYFYLNEDVLSKHTLLIGGAGSGKTTLFYHFINQIKRGMTRDDVMIIFDSKGDFAAKFYDSSTDVLIGNSRLYRKKSELWNIYKEILADGWNENDYIINAQEICKSFFEERAKHTNNAFFPNAARDLLAAVIVTFIREGALDSNVKREYFFNSKLKEFLNDSDAQRLLDLLEESPDFGAIKSYICGDGGQSQGVLSEMYSVMRDILVGIFAERGAFSIREFVRKKGRKTLFIEYDLSIGAALAPVYRLMFDLVLKEALGRSKPMGNVYLICDEFKLLPHLKHIDDAVNFGRSLGVKVFAGIQSIEQLYEIYGASRGKNIAAGFSSVYAFRANDAATREYVSGLFGKNIVLEQYRRADGHVLEEKRNGFSVEDWDLINLQVGEAVVGLPFALPFKFRFDL